MLGPYAGPVPEARGLASCLLGLLTLTEETQITSSLKEGRGRWEVGAARAAPVPLGHYHLLPPSHCCRPSLAPDGPAWVTSRLFQFLFSRSFCPPPPTACWVNSGSDWAGGIWCSRPELLLPSFSPECLGLPVAAGGGTWSGRRSHRARGYGTEGVAENGGLGRGI